MKPTWLIRNKLLFQFFFKNVILLNMLLTGCATFKPITIYDQSCLDNLPKQGVVMITDYSTHKWDGKFLNGWISPGTSSDTLHSADSLGMECFSAMEPVLSEKSVFSYICQDSLLKMRIRVGYGNFYFGEEATKTLAYKYNITNYLQILLRFANTGKNAKLNVYWTILGHNKDKKIMVTTSCESEFSPEAYKHSQSWEAMKEDGFSPIIYRNTWIDLARKNAEQFINRLKNPNEK